MKRTQRNNRKNQIKSFKYNCMIHKNKKYEEVRVMAKLVSDLNLGKFVLAELNGQKKGLKRGRRADKREE